MERYHFNTSRYELASGTSTSAAMPAVVRWDSEGAQREVLAARREQAKKPKDPICKMQAAPMPGQDSAPGYECSLQHHVLGEHDMPYNTRRAKVLIAGSWDPGHNCDGCGVSLSFFEFTAGQHSWQLTKSDFAAGEWGQDGRPNLLPFTVSTLGDEVPCIFAEAGGRHQGISERTTDIYARLENGFHIVGSIPTEYDDSSAMLGNSVSRTWHADICLDPHPASLHDLIVKTSGSDW